MSNTTLTQEKELKALQIVSGLCSGQGQAGLLVSGLVSVCVFGVLGTIWMWCDTLRPRLWFKRAILYVAAIAWIGDSIVKIIAAAICLLGAPPGLKWTAVILDLLIKLALVILAEFVVWKEKKLKKDKILDYMEDTSLGARIAQLAEARELVAYLEREIERAEAHLEEERMLGVEGEEEGEDFAVGDDSDEDTRLEEPAEATAMLPLARGASARQTTGW